VDRLTDEDQRMLWPDEIWPQKIGALAVLDGALFPGVRMPHVMGCVAGHRRAPIHLRS
jgi:hypothetical protein